MKTECTPRAVHGPIGQYILNGVAYD